MAVNGRLPLGQKRRSRGRKRTGFWGGGGQKGERTGKKTYKEGRQIERDRERGRREDK